MPQIISKLLEYDVQVERKTLYKDLKELQAIGMEVLGERKGTDYIYYVVDKEFELAEVKILVDAICASRFISESKTEDLIKKLSSLVSKYEGNSLKRQVYLNGRVKSMNESVYYNVDAIHKAIGLERLM